MAATEMAWPSRLRAARLRHTSLVLFTAGSSLFSRASTAGVLIIAAHKLTTAGLGLFATLFGIAVAAAYVLASTAGNILAYWTRANPELSEKAARTVLIVSVVSFILSIPIYLDLARGALILTLATLALIAAGVTATIILQLLRGTGRLKLAVTAGFLVPSVFRLALSAVLPGQVTVEQMLGASATAASIGALVGALIVLVAPTLNGSFPSFTYKWSVELSLAAGTVGLMWFALGQLDLTSLTIIRGPTDGGEYAPTMRAFEAMNALGLAVAFVSIRAFAGASLPTAVARIRRILPPSLLLYALITLPLLLYGHEVLTTLLDRRVFWSPVAVISLAIGYGGNLVMAICFEVLASQRSASKLFRAATLILALSLAITPLFILLWGISGAAMGNSLGYLLGGIIIFISINRSVAISQKTKVEQGYQCA
jgi:O-antigen/teichoic acid export membrane protein